MDRVDREHWGESKIDMEEGNELWGPGPVRLVARFPTNQLRINLGCREARVRGGNNPLPYLTK